MANKKGITVSEQKAVTQEKIKKSKPKPKKLTKEEKTKLVAEAKESTIDSTLKSARRLEFPNRRIDAAPSTHIGVGSVFEHARDKEKKCFAIGGTLTDVINALKGQTYALAGTGYHSDGTPIERVKGRNWEELYTEMLMYLATAEAMGCTYQGNFSSLKGLKSQTETSQALIDEMATDLKKMTLNASAFGSRHAKKIEEIDAQVRNIALRVQLANLQWDFANMGERQEEYARYRKLTDAQRTQFDKIVDKVRSVDDKDRRALLSGKKIDDKQLTDNQSELLKLVPFFYPPTEAELKKMTELTRTREKESDAMNSMLDERKKIIASPLPSGVSMGAAATKVASGLDTISEEIFGDMESEKGAMRSLLSEAMSAYASDSTLVGERLKTLTKSERGEFAKLLEILGRLRLAREALERDTADAVFKDKTLRKSISKGRERDVLEALAKDFATGADREKYKKLFRDAQKELQEKTIEATTEEEVSHLSEQVRAYGELERFLYGPKPTQAPEISELIQKAPPISPTKLLKEAERVVTGEPKPKRARRKRKFKARGKL